MDVEVHIDHESRRVHLRHEGAPGLQDFVEYIEKYWSDDRLYGYDELVDLQRAEPRALSHSDLLAIAQRAHAVDGDSPIARVAVVVSTPEAQELADFFAAARDVLPGSRREIGVFGSMEAARAWLDRSA